MMTNVNRRSVFSMIAGFFGVGAAAVAKPCKVIDRVTPLLNEQDAIILNRHMELRKREEDALRHQQVMVERWSSDLKKYEAALRYLADTIPQGNALMLYPCGCSASGIADPGVPRYCPTHDVDAKRKSECTVVRGTRLMPNRLLFHKNALVVSWPRIEFDARIES